MEQQSIDANVLAASAARLLVTRLPSGRSSRRLIGALRLTCRDVRVSVDAALQELSVPASKIQNFGASYLHPNTLVLRPEPQTQSMYSWQEQQTPAFKAPLNILGELRTLRLLQVDLGNMLTQELRPILGNIQALQLYLVECKSGQVPWASFTRLRTLVLHQRWDANYDLHQLRVVSATLVHLELKLDNDAEVSVVRALTQLTSLRVAAYQLHGDLGQLASLTQLQTVELRCHKMKASGSDSSADMHSLLVPQPMPAELKAGLKLCLAAWTQLRSLTLTSNLGREELQALAQLQHLTQLGCCTLMLKDTGAAAAAAAAAAGGAGSTGSSRGGNARSASSQRIRLASLQVLRVLATTPAALAALDLPVLQELTGLDMGRYKRVHQRYPPLTLYVFSNLSPSFIATERLQLQELASGHLQKCSSVCLCVNSPGVAYPEVSAVTAMLKALGSWRPQSSRPTELELAYCPLDERSLGELPPAVASLTIRGDDWRQLHRGLVLVPLAFHGGLVELDLRHVAPKDVSPYNVAGLMAASGQGRALRIWVPDGCLSRANFKRIRALATSMERGQGAPKLFQAYFYQGFEDGEFRPPAPHAWQDDLKGDDGYVSGYEPWEDNVLGSREEPDALERAQPAAGVAQQGNEEEEEEEEEERDDGSDDSDDDEESYGSGSGDDGSDEEGHQDDTEAQQRTINFDMWYQEKLKPKLAYMEMMGHLP